VDEIQDLVVNHIGATRDPASISTSSFPQIAADYALAMLEEGFWDDEKGLFNIPAWRDHVAKLKAKAQKRRQLRLQVKGN
jgi:hypothetical protein